MPTDNEGPDSGLDVPLPETLGGVGARLREARIRARLLGEPLQPVKIDRFAVLEHLGSGGMGEVYAAYDNKLDRKVAIKLVRSGSSGDPRANQRLAREAKILAQLSHPNVVQVYDVGVFEDRVFVAMELIRGQTLADWLDTARALPARRRQPQILRHFLAAGRGLEAAHRTGLAHRDFKPGNVLVGEDGHVRVVDFGLAGTAPMGHESDGNSPLESDVAAMGEGITATAPGRMVAGTPRYMAPEQLRGKTGDGRSDQFSFCVALYEALYGQPPFPMRPLGELAATIESGPPPAVPGGSAVPAAIRKAVLRGLSPDPADRFPTMGELLAQLETWPRRRSSLIQLGVVATAITVGLILFLMRSGEQPALLCTDAGEELGEVWNAERRAAISQAITQAGSPANMGSAYASEALLLILGKLDRYAADWIAMRSEACRAYQHGRESTNLYDRRVVCLSRRRSDLVSTIGVLAETSAASLDKVIDVTESLPSLAGCADREALLAALPLPGDATTRAQVADLEQRLGRARALEQAGRNEDAMAEITAVTKEAEATGYPPLLADALLAQGRIGIATAYGGCGDCILPLRRALEIGLALGLDALVVEAFARLVFAESSAPAGSGNDPLVYVPLAEAISKRVPDRRFVRALLSNNVGVVYLGRGDPERALEYFERSVAIGDAPDMNIELLRARMNIAMVTPDAQRRDERLAEALRVVTERLGSHHALTLRQRVFAGLYTRSPERAHAALVTACEDYAVYHPRSPDVPSYCLYHLGFADAELGRLDDAARRLSEFVASTAGQAGEAGKAGDPRALLARGYAELYRHAPAAAMAAFHGVIAAAGENTADPQAWWANTLPARARLGLGMSQQVLGRHEESIATLESALATLEQLCKKSYAVEFEQQRAQARLTLARSLWAVRRPKRDHVVARVQALLAAAETWYRTAGAGYAWRLDEIAAWRGATMLAPSPPVTLQQVPQAHR